MHSIQWRCVLAIVAGLWIGVLVVALSTSVNWVPGLAAGLIMGLLMAISEFSIEPVIE